MSERCVGRLPPHLFRRHVSRRTHDQSGFGNGVNRRCIGSGYGFRTGQLRQPEVQDLYPAVAGDKQIFRLQVAMYDALFVRRRQPPRHL